MEAVMGGRVLARVIRNLTDMHEGDEAWVDETEYVTGMVAGGYFVIVDREAPRDAVPSKKVRRGTDQAESE
jgi:hypothetical protein